VRSLDRLTDRIVAGRAKKHNLITQAMCKEGKISARRKEATMVLLDFSMTPLGKGESVSAYVARCLEVVAASGVDYRLHAMGTTLEGELADVLAVVRRCFEALETDCDRISCSIKIDYRKGPGGRLESKVRKVEGLLGRPLKTEVEE
jgi:uncharacterized protein (TIGR00106 family)